MLSSLRATATTTAAAVLELHGELGLKDHPGNSRRTTTTTRTMDFIGNVLVYTHSLKISSLSYSGPAVSFLFQLLNDNRKHLHSNHEYVY
jgi:hypothetical protein